LEYIKAINEKLKVNILKRITLIELEFTFYESEILVSGNYMKEFFLPFVDKFEN